MAEDTAERLTSGVTPDFPLPTSGNAPGGQNLIAEPLSQVRLQIVAVAKLNLADFQNAVPALRELAVCNKTSSANNKLTLVGSDHAGDRKRIWISSGQRTEKLRGVRRRFASRNCCRCHGDF